MSKYKPNRQNLFHTLLGALVGAVLGIIGTYLVFEKQKQDETLQSKVQEAKQNIIRLKNLERKVVHLFSISTDHTRFVKSTLPTRSTLASEIHDILEAIGNSVYMGLSYATRQKEALFTATNNFLRAEHKLRLSAFDELIQIGPYLSHTIQIEKTAKTILSNSYYNTIDEIIAFEVLLTDIIEKVEKPEPPLYECRYDDDDEQLHICYEL